MKKFIFLFIVLLWSGVLILLSFSRASQDDSKTPVSIDFSEWEKLYSWNVSKKAFVDIGFTNLKRWADTFYRHQLSPIDSIYYKSGDIKPLILEKKEGTNIVTFGSGIFVCNIQTGLEKYEFRLSDITLSPKGRGVFLIDTTHEQTVVFSFDAFLETELVSGIKRSHVANFTLFPSLLFKHDTRNTQELKDADLLRISIIDSIRYVDAKIPEDAKMIFSWENTKKDEVFFEEVQKDITARITAFVGLYRSINEQNSFEGTNSASFFDTSSSLLVNGSKREVLLKNVLIENILQLFNNPKKNIQYIVAINKSISEMKTLNLKVYADGLSILRQYYYITSFSHFVSNDNSFDFLWQVPSLLTETEKIIPNSRPKQGEYYTHLSDLFSVYYFLALGSQELNNSFEKILQRIIDNKVLAKEEFLPFAFFVTRYLSTGPVIPNESTLLIISHLFQITNDYYTNNKTDGVKLATVTSTTFYNYNKIFVKIYSIFLSTFIDKTPEGLLLKKEYIDGENNNFEQSFINAFVQSVAGAKQDMEAKRDILYSNGSFQPDSRVTDSFTLLSATLKTFDTPLFMFSNYSKYLNDFHLNDRNRSARGILLDAWHEPSRELLEAYLKNFNNLDISSLQVANDFKKDGFYEVQVGIVGSVFQFKLWEQDHVLADISYADTFWKKHIFPNITIPLDQKAEQFKELFTWSDDPILQYKYDFKNFFEVTFLKSDSNATSTTPEILASPEDTSATPEIQLFIQKELLDKDFKNIESFLPIGFKNINASIKDGERIINLTNVNKTFAGNNSFATELSGKYIFNRHSFSRLLFKVKKDVGIPWYEFNEISIEILPARISLLSLPDNLKDLGYYIEKIKSSYTNQKSIVIDLTGKKVILDQVPFTPIFPIP